MTPDFASIAPKGKTPAAAPEYAVEMRNITKTYRGQGGEAAHKALHDVSLQIPRGSIYGLLGPNGAGKSTLINILAGTVFKSGGTARIWGIDIDEAPKQARAAIGIVPQELNIDAFFTPREALEFMAGMYAVPKAERRTDEILAEIDLSDKANAYARTLSGGMRRRLLVGKAMVHQPPVLVLDEPTAGVDVLLRQKLWALIRKLNESGVTIILTTHYLDEAEALCDRIAIISQGSLVADNDTRSLVREMNKKSLHLTIANPPADLPPALNAMEAELDGNSLRITFAPESTNAGAVLTEVEKAGLTITDISTAESNLEDIFLELTRKP